MSTILIFILVVVGFTIFSFIKDSTAETDKYKILIDNFIDPESGMRVIQKNNKYMCVGINNNAGSVVFHFQHTFNKINITFEMKNIFIGDHKLEWDFPETMPQTDMIRHIENRTRQYMENVTSQFK